MPFEDELGEALRRAGDGFTTDRYALVEAGEQRGRRLVARRRAGVIGGSVLSLALIGAAGAYTGGLLDGSGPGRTDVAAPVPLPNGQSGKGTGAPDGKTSGGGTGSVTGEQLLAVFKELLPGGKLTNTDARGTADPSPAVSGVYDDGRGKAAIMLGLSRVDPNGSDARQLTECADKNLVEYDDCTTEQLTDGSKLLIEQGYEYPDRRVDTKAWRAVLVTPQGFKVTASEWNAAREKGAGISRPTPPLTPAQLKALVTSVKWHPALNDLPAADKEKATRPEGPVGLPDLKGLQALERLVINYEIPVVSKGGENGFGYVVLDDGKGKSLVQLNIAKDSGASDFKANAAPLADGTQVNIAQGPTEKGKGVVQWTADTLRKNGLRVTVTAYNTANQSGAATRETPALTLDQLKELATAPGWNRSMD
ncbi:hypothetical protein [Streptomyces sp. NPDC091371]|uniref:hypothetical protein n=1 Tax=Streptomyces sp. NPDC091371 TaxID=3155303 RepID=UPI00341830FC